MAHEITAFDSFVRANGTKPAWHGLGLELPEGIRTATDAGRHAGILWPTRCVPIMAQVPQGDGNTRTVNCPDDRAQVRMDTGAVLGVVSKQYAPLQNSDLAGIVDACVEVDPAYSIETAGTLSGGRRCFFLLRGPAWDACEGDANVSYVLACNAHAGIGKAGCWPTTVRVVCRNTERAARRDETKGLAIRHVGDMQAKLRQLRAVMGACARWHALYRQQAGAMVSRQLTSEARRDLMHSIALATLGDPRKVEDLEARAAASEKLNDTVRAWARLLDAGTNNLPGMRGSVWQVLQAITEWHDHQRPTMRDSEERATFRIFGEAATDKALARQLCVAAL